MMKIFTRRLFQSFRFSTSTEPIGHVYTWGDEKPQKLSLPQKAKRVSLGQRHSCIVGESGNIYTYGENKYGQLGHGNKESVKVPKIVEYFEKKNIKIKQALCGQDHTIALTEEGQVYTFGHGGRKSYMIMNLFVSKASPLGHGNQQSVLSPKRVKFFENMKIQRITAGSLFNFAIDSNGRIYYWGCGQYGVAGDAGIKNCNVPQPIQYFQYLQEEQKLTIKKIKSIGTSSISLMTNGILYGWGSNQTGHIGIKNEIGIELHEMVSYPHMMIREGFENEKVKNFDISENVTLFQLQNNQFWWCGRSVAFKPERVMFQQQDNIKLFAAGSRSFVLVSNSNNIYSSGKFFNKKGKQDLKTGIVKIESSQIFESQIIGIGGQYGQRYAILA